MSKNNNAIWIFGDSYADDKHLPFGIKDNWTNLLRYRGYNVFNFSLSGTGPDWSLQRFLLQTRKTKNTKDIVLIFLISEITRFPFSFLRLRDQVFKPFKCFSDQNQSTKDLTHRYRRHMSFMKRFYRYYYNSSSYEETEVEKIIGYLYLQHFRFKKTLAWSIFKEPSLTLPKSESFYIPDFKLSDLTHETFGLGEDIQMNHLRDEYHPIFADSIHHWIKYNSNIVLEDFPVIRI